MSKPIIAAQMYTLRMHCTDEMAIDQSFAKVKAMGYNAVQVSGLAQIPYQMMKDLADKYDLKICCTHISFDKMVQDIDDVIEQHKIYDCKYAGVGSMPKEYAAAGADGYKKFAVEASVVGEKLNAAGLQFIYHNHNFEFNRFGEVGNTKSGMEILFDESDKKAFQFELDTYWIQAGGACPVKWIYKVKDRMKVVHFKDMAMDGREQLMTEIGEGNLDWAGIIKACDDIGVEWCPIEQDKCQRDEFESLEISLKNLKAMGCSF